MPKWLIVLILVLIVAGVVYFVSARKAIAPVDNSSVVNTNPTNATMEQPKPDFSNKQAVMETTLGNITLEFYPADAPLAVENFIGLAEKGYYNGVIFHRVVKDFVIQAGDPTGTGRGGASIFGNAFKDELDPSTASYQAGYQKGVLAMANSGPNTNGSQFFILLKDTPLQHLYTIFGRVTAGQEVVDKIGRVIVDPETDKPITPVVINKVVIKNK